MRKSNAVVSVPQSPGVKRAGARGNGLLEGPRRTRTRARVGQQPFKVKKIKKIGSTISAPPRYTK